MFFAGLTLLPSLFLELVKHLFNSFADNIGTGRLELLGAGIKLVQNLLIDTYPNQIAFGIVRWWTPHLFGRHRLTPLFVSIISIFMWQQKVNEVQDKPNGKGEGVGQ